MVTRSESRDARSERPAEDRDVSESERFSMNTDETDRRKDMREDTW